MNDNAPHKPTRLYSPWRLAILIVFVVLARYLWDSWPVVAVVVALVGVFIFVKMDNRYNRKIKEDVHFQEWNEQLKENDPPTTQ